MLNITNDPVTAGSSLMLTAAPQAPGGGAATALQAFVKVVCLTTNTVIREESAVSVNGPIINIDVTGAENEIVDPSNASEKRRVLLRLAFGVGDDFTDYADFKVFRADLPPDGLS